MTQSEGTNTTVYWYITDLETTKFDHETEEYQEDPVTYIIYTDKESTTFEDFLEKIKAAAHKDIKNYMLKVLRGFNRSNLVVHDTVSMNIAIQLTKSRACNPMEGIEVDMERYSDVRGDNKY